MHQRLKCTAAFTIAEPLIEEDRKQTHSMVQMLLIEILRKVANDPDDPENAGEMWRDYVELAQFKHREKIVASSEKLANQQLLRAAADCMDAYGEELVETYKEVLGHDGFEPLKGFRTYLYARKRQLSKD